MNVVCIGGGGGQSKVMEALRFVEGIKITAICPSTDSGGSTGALVRDYNAGGYLGDLTKCIAALCPDDDWAKGLMHRFGRGELNGHSSKNIVLHALIEEVGLDRALVAMFRHCGLGQHRVLPVTHEKTELCARLKIGNTTVVGETNIDNLAGNCLWNPDIHAIEDIFLKPAVRASDDVLAAIAGAHYIVICPGDLYSSIIPVLLPVGVREAIKASPAKIISILNIMTKRGETDNYTADDFIRAIESKLWRRADHIICNNQPIAEEILARYALESKIEMVVSDNEHDPRFIFVPMAMVNEAGQILSDPEVINFELTKIFWS